MTTASTLGAPASLPAPDSSETAKFASLPAPNSSETTKFASPPAHNNKETTKCESLPASNSKETTKPLGAPATLPTTPNHNETSKLEAEPELYDGDLADHQPTNGNGENLRAHHPALDLEGRAPDFSTPECHACLTALRVTDKFCWSCGEPQPNRVLPFMKLCLSCNTLLPEKANYCYACGTDVGYNSRRKVRVPHELFRDEESEFFPRFDA